MNRYTAVIVAAYTLFTAIGHVAPNRRICKICLAIGLDIQKLVSS